MPERPGSDQLAAHFAGMADHQHDLPLDPLPVRLVSRISGEAGLLSLHTLLELVPGRFESAVVLQALVRAALPGIARLRSFDELKAPVPVGSVKGLARSFDKPVETMRRHAQTLARLGYVTVGPDGLHLAPEPAAGQRVLAFLRATHDLMLWLVAELDGWGVLPRPAQPQSRPGRGVPRERVMRSGLDLMLLPFETFRGAFATWTDFAVWNTLSTASVRRIVLDRALGARHAVASTPDERREAIGLRALCDACGLPYATVWRHVGALLTAGLIARRDTRYVVLTEQLRTEAMEARVVLDVQQTLARCGELVAGGLDPHAVADLYIGPPPRLTPIRFAEAG